MKPYVPSLILLFLSSPFTFAPPVLDCHVVVSFRFFNVFFFHSSSLATVRSTAQNVNKSCECLIELTDSIKFSFTHQVPELLPAVKMWSRRASVYVDYA